MLVYLDDFLVASPDRLSHAAHLQSLMQSVCLAFPSDNAELSLAMDASATHMGAVLQQREGTNADWWPLGFFLAKLEAA